MKPSNRQKELEKAIEKLSLLGFVSYGKWLFFKNGIVYDLSAADLNQIERIENEGLFIKDKMTESNILLLVLASKGLSNKEIGEELGVKERTIKNRFTVIYKVLSAKNRAHAVATALREGLIK